MVDTRSQIIVVDKYHDDLQSYSSAQTSMYDKPELYSGNVVGSTAYAGRRWWSPMYANKNGKTTINQLSFVCT